MKKKQQEAIVRELVDNLNYDKIHRAMSHLDWRWAGKGIPDILQLRATAEWVVRMGLKDNSRISGTGGFTLYRFGKRKKARWILTFELTTWDTSCLELEQG